MNKIPLSVSSTLTNVAQSSFLTVTPYANNTGKTGTAAPVLIAVESDGTVGVEAFAEALPAKGGQGTAAQARLVINAMAEVLTDLVAEYGAVTVNTPLGRIDTFVAGSLEYATDPVDPTVNVPFLGIVPGADVMKAFAKIETYVPTAACPASLKRVRDVATGDNAIHGVQPFYAQGYGMTYGGTGETVKLLNALTRAEVCTVAVDAATKSQAQLKCTLPNTAAIAAGAYILQVTTLAGGTETLWPLELKVNLAEAVVPVPTPIYSSTLGGTKIYSSVDENGNALPAGPIKSMTATAKMNLTGVFYQTPDADPDTGVSHIYLDGVGTERIELMGVFAEDHGSLTIRLGECITQVAAGTYANAKLSFKCYKDSQADSLEIPFTLIKG